MFKVKKGGVNAIIIDDEQDILEILEDYLLQVGDFRNIIKAYGIQEAFLKIMNQDFDLIVLDVNLEKRSGIDLVERLKDRNPNMLDKIVLISGELDKKTVNRALSLGVKNFLVKPLNLDTFKAKVGPMVALKESA